MSWKLLHKFTIRSASTDINVWISPSENFILSARLIKRHCQGKEKSCWAIHKLHKLCVMNPKKIKLRTQASTHTCTCSRTYFQILVWAMNISQSIKNKSNREEWKNKKSQKKLSKQLYSQETILKSGRLGLGWGGPFRGLIVLASWR